MPNSNVPLSNISNETLSDREIPGVVSSLPTAIWSLVVMAAVLLISRRISGAITLPSSVWPCFLTTGIGLMLTGFAYWVDSLRRQPRETSMRQLTIGLLTIVPPLTAGGLLLPADSSMGLSMFLFGGFGLLMMTGLIPWEVHFATEAKSDSPIKTTPSINPIPEIQESTKNTSELTPELTSTEVLEKRLLEANSLFSENDNEADLSLSSEENEGTTVSQRMSRSLIDDEETDMIEGVVTVEFSPGQKLAIVHIPFSPPFHESPKIECELENSSDVRLRQYSLQSYGARLDARRSQNLDEGTKITIAYVATAKVSHRKVA